LAVFNSRKAIRQADGGIKMVIVRDEKRAETASIEAPEKAVLPQPKPKHIGGGWYELPDGQKVRKKDLEAGD